MGYDVQKSDEDWRAELSADEYAVLRQAATERPWTGELLDEGREGTYRCKACSAELFRSTTKFDSHCGWPSFYDPSTTDAVELITDSSSEWCAPRCAAPRAARTWATSSTTHRRPPRVTATA